MAESFPDRNLSVPESTDEEMVFALRKIARSFALYSKHIEKQTGLTASQLLLLRIVCDAGPKSIGKIAQRLNLSQATATGLVKRLEKRGLIDKIRDTSDRRRMIIDITPSGRRLLEGAPPLIQHAFVDRFTRLESWERAMILSSLQRLAVLMDNESGSSPARA